MDNDLHYDPDKGSGVPGSLTWHGHCILECTTMKELADYFESVTGKEFPASPESRVLALRQIKEFLDGKGK